MVVFGGLHGGVFYIKKLFMMYEGIFNNGPHINKNNMVKFILSNGRQNILPKLVFKMATAAISVSQ